MTPHHDQHRDRTIAQLEADRVFVTGQIITNARRLQRIEEALAERTSAAGDLAHVRDLAGEDVTMEEEA